MKDWFDKVFREHIFPYIVMSIGAVMAAFALEEFLIPSTILDGGVTGVSMILNKLSGINEAYLIYTYILPC